ncbi:MAG: hypothetical protein ABSC37_19185 [Xanthobacteraceae bacterium]|jgi:hypothetical protein
MVQLVDSDIKTREVLGWKGVHVLHFIGSSCSQKLRAFLNLKGNLNMVTASGPDYDPSTGGVVIRGIPCRVHG